MVNTGTATDAVTIAAVTSAALALMINSLMFYLLVGIKRLLGWVDTQNFLGFGNGAHSNTGRAKR
jgi:hypothetical protein